MPLYGYGEDSLTLCALTGRLSEFLDLLDDASDRETAIVLYRPSFGRSAKSSPFGEFDAIVGTPKAVYLVEAKWSRSGEAWESQMNLRSEQLRRHRIFRWYLERWRAAPVSDWAVFMDAAAREQFGGTFEGKALAPSGSILAQSLEYTMTLLAACGAVEDVLLYCDIDGRPCPPNVEGFCFTQVYMRFLDATPSGFFPMDIDGRLRSPAI